MVDVKPDQVWERRPDPKPVRVVSVESDSLDTIVRYHRVRSDGTRGTHRTESAQLDWFLEHYKEADRG